MNERFDIALQMWVDENGNPIYPQPSTGAVSSNNPDIISSNQVNPNIGVNFADIKIPNVPTFGKTRSGGLFQTNLFEQPKFELKWDAPTFNNQTDRRSVQQKAIDNTLLKDSAQQDARLNSPTLNTALNTDVKMEEPKKDGMFDFLNNVGKTYSLESALYGLGHAVGKKDYTGMTEQEIKRSKNNDLLMGVGSAGKALLGGARTFTSGMSNRRMSEWMINEYKNKRRDALVNNQTGSEYAYAAVGGAPFYNFQEGGEMPQEADIVTQLQQAVQNGEMTEEEANAYLQQAQQESPQEQPQQGGLEEIQAQLAQAVQNGEITEEEAMAYLQQISQQSGGQQQQQQPQISPEEAQQQLAMAVDNGEISPEEAQTYLQQLYGEVQAGSEPQEVYTGELREKVKPEQYLTGEYTAGDDDKPYNSEVERGEYLNRNGVTQQVLGDKHSEGGEKMNLEKGTIVISDKTRLGAANARALSLNTGMKIVAGDTYARVVDIFTKKIGLEKLNKEQEDLFKKLQKFEGKGNQKTQDLNNTFLNAKINDIEEKKKSLLQQREQLVQVLFEMQESSKKPSKDEKESVDNSSEESREVPKYQDGVMVSDATGEAILERYGADAYKYYLENWKNDPDYGFRDYVPMRERIKAFAEDYGVTLPKNFDKLSEKEMDKLAGEIQMKVNDGVATHYGTYVAPTQNGLQWLVDNGVLKKDNDAIKNIIDKNGKITIGSYGALNEKQQQVVGNAVDGLAKEDEAKLKQYAIANFRDKKWFYRRPKEQEIYYTSAQEYGDAVKDKLQVGQPNEYATEKQGAYFLPKLLQIKKFKTQAELDKWKEANKNNADKKHSEYFSETGGDSNKFFKPVVDDSVEPNKPEVVADKPLDVSKTKKRNNFFMLPDQSTLPPEPLRAVPKYGIRYNYLDNIRISPEQNLVENYRNFNEAKTKMEALPDVMNNANLAMLTGNIAQANNQAINQINVQNAQIAQQVASANLQTLHKQAEMDLHLADQYDQRMNRALDVTRKDLEGYYDFNRKVNVGEFNTRHQLSLLNDLFDKYGVNSDGTVGFDPKTNAPYGVNREQWIAFQEYRKQQEADAKAKAEKQQREANAKAEVAKTAPLPTSGWGK